VTFKDVRGIEWLLSMADSTHVEMLTRCQALSGQRESEEKSDDKLFLSKLLIG
jgi:hypothetical protein